MAFFTFRKPHPETLEPFLQAQLELPVTYRGSLSTTVPPGHRQQHTKALLGQGEGVFGRAVRGLQAWAVYPAWMNVYPRDAPLTEGTCVALVTGLAPVWTVSAVRVVATQATSRRFCFTLGTLPQHAVSGLERFSLSWAEDDTVWYEIMAVSRAQQPLVRVASPLLQLVQRRFARDSVRSLGRFIRDT